MCRGRGSRAMSTMACRCGAIISDVIAPSPTEGWLFLDQDEERFQDSLSEDIASFFAACRVGQRESWLRNFFSSTYPSDLSDQGVVSDIVALHARTFSLSICECSQCGRLQVQRSIGENSYIGYAPD